MVIDSDGKQLGALPTREGIRLATERGLDLVEVAPLLNPPVCKIMDYGKYLYQQNKRHSSRHRNIAVKEVKVRPRINEHDLLFKMNNIKKFIAQGNKAKVTMMFRGREIVHASDAKKIFDRIVDEITDIASIEQMVKFEGNRMIMVLAPK